jgi:ATP-dependent RNA helicase RhlB
VAPTRELASQIGDSFQTYGRHTGLRQTVIFGGVSQHRQTQALKQGIDILVIDEADRLFDMGFLPDLRRIASHLPPPGVRQSMLFSATLDRAARGIALVYLNEAVFIELSPERIPVDAISQELYHVKSHLKLNLLLGILAEEKPRNALIFTNMRHSAARLARKLELNGFRSRYLSGDLPQNQRLRIIDDFMAGKFSYLVATDVAARGLHIDNLEMVINYDLPQDIENYVHRIGRTARAGNSGQAVSFACEKFGKHLDDIESFIGMKIPVETPEAGLFATDNGLEYELKMRARQRHSEPGRRQETPGGRRGMGLRWGQKSEAAPA